MPFGMIREFAETGVMPNTAELISQGIFKKMRSSVPEISCVAWSSLITGKNPGWHGIFGFTDLADESYKIRFPNFNDLKAKVEAITADFNGKQLDKLACLESVNASAENVAKYLYEKIEPSLPPHVKLDYVEVGEAPGCWAKYSR